MKGGREHAARMAHCSTRPGGHFSEHFLHPGSTENFLDARVLQVQEILQIFESRKAERNVPRSHTA